MRYGLRTLLILLAVGPPLLAIGSKEWLRYCRALETVVACQTELAAARLSLIAGPTIGFGKSLSGVRRAQLNLARENEAARRDSLVYRLAFPATPK